MIQTGLYKYQAKVKGKITKTNLASEALTSSWTGTIIDADTGAARTLTLNEYYLLFIDPKNEKKQGVEAIIAKPTSLTDGEYTFTDTFRGIDLDNQDDAGGKTNAKSWTPGTTFGIVTEHQNNNFLRDIIAGTTRWPNAMGFSENQTFLKRIQFAYTPAFLTGGASPTTTVSTWAALTDAEFAITIDGTARDITGIDFTNHGHLDQVAKTIQTAIRAVTSGTEIVEWTGTVFKIYSGDTTSTSAITVTSAVAAGAGTDISGAGGTNFLDCDTGNGTVTGKVIGMFQSTVVADMTERDALSSLNGDECYVDAEGKKYDYLAGAWIARESGGTFPNGSTTVAGKFEEGTVAEQGTATATGFTGARLVPAVENLVKTSSGAGDENKMAVLDATGKFATGFIPDPEIDNSTSEPMTTGENVTAGNALRVKNDGLVYKTLKEQMVSNVENQLTSATASTDTVKAVQIDDNVVAYAYMDSSSNLKAITYSYEGDKKTALSSVTAVATIGANNLIDMCKVATNKFAIVYYDGGTGIDVIICTYSGGTITVGTPVAVIATNMTSTDTAYITSSDTDVISIAYPIGTTDNLTAVTATVSGTIPTLGTPINNVVTANDSADFSDIVEIGSGKVVVVGKNGSDDLSYNIATISGNTMTFGGEGSIQGGITLNGVSIEKVEDDKFIVSYRDSGTGYHVVCTVSGTTATPGTDVVAPQDAVLKMLYVSDGLLVTTYNNTAVDASATHTIAYLSVTGTTVTIKDIAKQTDVSTPLFVVKYEDDIFQAGFGDVTNSIVEGVRFTDNNFIGFADTTVTSGNTVQTNFLFDDNQTALIAGAKYYLSGSGAISLTGTVEAGTALSTTKILRK